MPYQSKAGHRLPLASAPMLLGLEMVIHQPQAMTCDAESTVERRKHVKLVDAIFNVDHRGLADDNQLYLNIGSPIYKV
ncbi:hypothetical protein ACFX15_031718 [Malus domestica]